MSGEELYQAGFEQELKQQLPEVGQKLVMTLSRRLK